MATSYERVLEAARRYSRDPRLQELPRDTSGRQHAQCSCPAHDGDGGTSLHITYDQSDGKTMLHCFGAEHCDAAAIADALGLKIIDLFDQQSGPQGHAGYSSYNSYSCDSRLTAADLASIRHANAPLLNRNETTTITPTHTENSAEIRQQYAMPKPYLEPLALGQSLCSPPSAQLLQFSQIPACCTALAQTAAQPTRSLCCIPRWKAPHCSAAALAKPTMCSTR